MPEKDSGLPSALERAWVVLAHHGQGKSYLGHSFVAVLASQLRGQPLLDVVSAIYSAIAQQVAGIDSPIESPDVGFIYLNDGSLDEDAVFCGGKSTISLDVWCAYDVKFFHDDKDVSFIRWRVKHVIVNQKGARELDFWDDLALPVTGIAELISFDT